MKTLKQIQEETNKRVLERMKNPYDNLQIIRGDDVAFQPRPIIKKDKAAIKKLYPDVKVD